MLFLPHALSLFLSLSLYLRFSLCNALLSLPFAVCFVRCAATGSTAVGTGYISAPEALLVPGTAEM